MLTFRRFEGSCLLLVFSLTAVSCQVQVEGFTGGEVLLPCIYPGSGRGNVYWRDKDNYSVLEIRDNKANTSSRNNRFTGRVESFPELYVKGNYSIVLKKLQLSDNGAYECSIPTLDFMHKVKLSVSEKRVAMTTPRPGPADGADGADGAAVALSSILLTLLSVLLSSRHVL